MLDHPWLNLLLIAAGVVGGALNVVAGGGSFLTLPVLILMGLPAGVANGTNRVGVLVQNAGAVWTFRRSGVWDPAWALQAAIPSILGAIAGTLVATWMHDDLFRRILSWLMIVMSLWTLWDPIGRRRTAIGGHRVHLGWGALIGFFLAGIYGGFVQAGVGFILLAVTTLAGYDLVRGNAIKVLCVLISTPVSLAIFAWSGQVWWVPGLWLAAGMVLGGLLGAHLTVLKGHLWVRGIVTAAVIVLAIKLLVAP